MLTRRHSAASLTLLPADRLADEAAAFADEIVEPTPAAICAVALLT
jgi:hypothetical protein